MENKYSRNQSPIETLAARVMEEDDCFEITLYGDSDRADPEFMPKRDSREIPIDIGLGNNCCHGALSPRDFIMMMSAAPEGHERRIPRVETRRGNHRRP